MSKNLASLIKNVRQGSQTSAIDETQLKAQVWEQVGEQNLMYIWHGSGSHNCNYCRTCYLYCISNAAHPSYGTRHGVPNRVRFEIWGAGGYGAMPENCGIAVPSGAGAYAHKTICGSDVVAGSCYYIKLGHSYCCLPQSGGSNTTASTECREIDCHSSVVGTGLTNFCAEVGRGTRIRCCNFNATNFDSDNAKLWTLDSHDQGGLGPQAPYYGADGGSKGKLGYVTKKPGAPADNPLSYVQHIPYAGGKIDQCGGHLLYPNVHYGHDGAICCGSDFSQHCCINALYHGVSIAPSYYVAGQGWGSGHVCSGTVCSGNNPGRVKITSWYEES